MGSRAICGPVREWRRSSHAGRGFVTTSIISAACCARWAGPRSARPAALWSGTRKASSAGSSRSGRGLKKAWRLKGWLVFLDESGLLLLPVVRRTWSRCGHPQCSDTWAATARRSPPSPRCASVRPVAKCVCIFSCWSMKTSIRWRCWDFSASSPATFTIRCCWSWDRARIHRDLRVAVFVDVSQWRQFYFPPYAPELNPVEYVWGYLKSNPLANLASPKSASVAATGHFAYVHCVRGAATHVLPRDSPPLGVKSRTTRLSASSSPFLQAAINPLMAAGSWRLCVRSNHKKLGAGDPFSRLLPEYS